MGKEELRTYIIQRQCGVKCSKKSETLVVAGHLASLWPWIFGEKDQEIALKVYGYGGIEALKKDARELADSLHQELNEEDWKKLSGHFLL